MTKEELSTRALAMQDALYRVSTSLLCQLADREDAVQEALRRAWQSRHTLRRPEAFSAWLMRILINECYAILRGRKREIPVERLPEPRETAPDADPELYTLFTALPDTYRLPLLLHYMEGYKVAEIGKMLGLPQGTVKARLHRGRKLLKGQLSGETPSHREVKA